MEKIQLTEKVGNAEKGSIFIQGLHGVPDHDVWKDEKPEDFYWKAETPKKENSFLFVHTIWGKNEETGEEWNYAKKL